MAYPVGKLPAHRLAELLAKYCPLPLDVDVRIGATPGEDAAAIDLGDRVLLVTTDPITFATEALGWYAVNVCANDIAVMGGVPRWFLACILLPEGGADDALVERIFADIAGAAQELGIIVVGGHTEITEGLDRPIVVGHILGEVATHKLVTSAGAQPGDALLLAKPLGIEATAIAARECAEELYEAGAVATADDPALQRLRDYLVDPGISVVAAAHTAVEAGGVSAMHDPTEGGVATALHELADAADVGLEVTEESLIATQETLAVCRALGMDILGVISSGSLLVTCSPDAREGLLRAFARVELPCWEIGTIVPREGGRTLLGRKGEHKPLPRFARDEITKLFDP